MPGLGRDPPGPALPPGRGAPPGRGMPVEPPGRGMPVEPPVEYGLLPGRGAAARPMPLEPPEVNGLLPGRGPAGTGRRGRRGPPGVTARRRAVSSGCLGGGSLGGCRARRGCGGRRDVRRGGSRRGGCSGGGRLGLGDRGRRGGSRRGRGCGGCRLLGGGLLGGSLLRRRRRGRHGVPELAYDGRLDGRRGRPDELPHLCELGHDGLALDTELLGELVDPDLCHNSPVSVRTGVFRRTDRRYCTGALIGACSSGAHQRLDSLPDWTVY